jgi:hypothetical protein
MKFREQLNRLSESDEIIVIADRSRGIGDVSAADNH